MIFIYILLTTTKFIDHWKDYSGPDALSDIQPVALKFIVNNDRQCMNGCVCMDEWTSL